MFGTGDIACCGRADAACGRSGASLPRLTHKPVGTRQSGAPAERGTSATRMDIPKTEEQKSSKEHIFVLMSYVTAGMVNGGRGG